MSDIDIQIAQILGWELIRPGRWKASFPSVKEKQPKVFDYSCFLVYTGRLQCEIDTPPFSSSLDLMHELEMMIPEEKQYAYYKYVEREVALGDVLFKKYEDSRYAPYRFLVITATAEQRAPAWKKVMGGE